MEAFADVPLLPASTDYTHRDFDALRARLVALTKSVFPDWTDFDVASFGNVLLEMHAFIGDVLGFYQDNLARESRLSTATQRRNVIALARMLGYRLHGAQAATAEVELRLTQPPAATVTFPAGTVVRTQEVTEAVRFQLLSSVTIQAGTNPPRALAVVEHSKTHTQLFDARGLADFEAHLDFAPYLDGSASVSTAQGAFSEVDTFLNSRASDAHVLVSVDQGDKATIRFGNGVNGLPPVGTVAVVYKTGGGAAGNVDAGRLVVLEGSFRDAHGHAVQVAVSNAAPASGGADRQTVASAKLLAPESLRALTRTVSREDFEINARRLPGVARALMLTSNEDATIAENAGILYVVPQGGGVPTPALKAQVLRQVTEVYPCTLTFQVSIQEPVYRRVDVSARLFLRQGTSVQDVAARISQALAVHFRVSEPDGTPNPRIDFGFNLKDAQGFPAGEVAWSDVFNVIRDVPGVRKLGDARMDLTLNGLPADVKLTVRELPVLGSVTLQDGDTGGLL
ncbi:baseplate J/gp47 family protein [Myxococcus llanfairpwllgwyngyllgogerychwyrndrobwllllantysiliogogogochensis]|uniref:baseplate J/gp47 family protein n=1 Tax=Myxococcus llanfairpwllgwyngyllgogerychwyrndrobwllllantysiliogogogochensis TaxID=2590453 RepID=UPI0015F0F5AD|nr:baseplate J/gp47 family protein [Myxococcus llanfairpwllgwyngyllgogerychwyrndrobwllllantysiliogogogochensis]